MNEKGLMYNYINGEWRTSAAAESLEVLNPANAETLTCVPLSPVNEVEQAAQAALRAYQEWKRVPVVKRIQPLFKLRALLEEHVDELSRLIVLESGKTFEEAKGEIVRAIENVEVACGMPTLMQGDFSEDISTGIDEFMIRQPVGVAACICPFNFPGMIAFWFFPYAVAAGNTYIVKPSERVPMTMQRVFELIDQCGFPKGVINLVNGSRQTVNAILDHPDIRAISFVGSTSVAKYVYARAAANGKRAQCQGGAKNPVIIMPDADMETSVRILADSVYGCAGQRCAAVSLGVMVGDAEKPFLEAFTEVSRTRTVGFGLDKDVQMGPLISAASRDRIEGLIARGVAEGATLHLDGRRPVVKGYEKGYFIKPTILTHVSPNSELAKTELFGPVFSIMHADSLDEAIRQINTNSYGNMACIFTSSGASARKFRNEVEAGDIGVNIGIAAPMAFFPFSGWKDSFFGTQHAQSKDAVDFFTQKKVVVERWPKDWTRKF
ncbi:MAG: CoA-acylating methylmalonate-semialdehyde dehydrogenase [Chloroflexi bacterium]|nr:CoA-acylating methylmalonate-semialdehyde dehydrogenase [Chloroflexota bacterium]